MKSKRALRPYDHVLTYGRSFLKAVDCFCTYVISKDSFVNFDIDQSTNKSMQYLVHFSTFLIS